MTNIVVLSDNSIRARNLSRGLKPLGALVSLELENHRSGRLIPTPSAVRLVVSDVSSPQTRTFDAVASFLKSIPASTPHILLLPANAPRPAWVETGPQRTLVLAAESEDGILATALALLGDTTPDAAAVAPAVTHTAEVLSTLFAAGRDGQAIEPSLITAGSDIILDAVMDSSLLAWVDVVRRFDDAVHQHCLLVAGLVGGLSKSLGFRAADCRRLTQAALVHDVGKARILVEILNKPGALTPEERVVINTHPGLGHEMLLGKGFSDEIMAVVRSHHEFLDGSGYPDARREEEIPDMVRLVTICDIFAALIERRAYKAPMNAHEALSILQKMGPKIDQVLLRASRTYLSSASGPAQIAAE